MPRLAIAALLVVGLVAPAAAVDPVRPNTVRPNTVAPDGGSSGSSSSGSSGRVSPRDDCHGYVREHYLPEFGRSVRHSHTGPDCRPLLADPDDFQRRFSSDCHGDARSHWLPGAGGKVLHRHVGDDCRVRIIRRSGSGG